MVGWGFAFKKGFILLLWCILWAIVGALIFVIIGIGSLLPLVDVILNPTAEALTPEALARIMPPLAIGVIVGVIIGSLIPVIGVFASLVKVVTDAVEEQKRMRADASLACPDCGAEIRPEMVHCSKCGRKLRTMKTCPSCDYENPRYAERFCIKCGSQLKAEVKPSEKPSPSTTVQGYEATMRAQYYKRRCIRSVALAALGVFVALILLYVPLNLPPGAAYTFMVAFFGGIYFFLDFLYSGFKLIRLRRTR